MKQKIIGFALLAIVIGVGGFAWLRLEARSVSVRQGSGSNALRPLAGSSSMEQGQQGTSGNSSAKMPVPAPASGVVASDPRPRPKTITEGNKTYPLVAYKALAAPNDPSASQWWVTQSKLDQMWALPAGSHQTVLAIVDTGFALKHEEFANRWYVNPGESGAATTEAASLLNCTDRGLPLDASCNLIDDDGDGIVDNETGAATYENPSRKNCTDQSKALDKSCNRIDDDGNGYVDDVSGWDFVNGDNSPQAGELNPSGTGTTHGTKVAGIAAATGNNGKGIAGADWNTKILPIQAMDDDSYGDTLGVGRSIYYAIKMHADVISLSLGSGSPDAYVRQAVQAALAAGIPVVAAAGNDGCDCMVYPAAYPETLAVGALNSSEQPASFDSYGASLDILAPGTNMATTTWQAANQTSAYISGINGTSFATPLVAGMLTSLKSWQPSATPEQLMAAVTETVNRLTLPSTTILDPHYGFGTLDAFNAASRMTAPRSGQFNYTFSPVSTGAKLNPSAPAEPGGNAFAYACETGAWPSTPIFELIKGTSQFYTISKVERQQAIDAGYTADLLAYSCLRQPQDAGNVMRNLNIYKEFRNIDYKGY